jgi:hypothetical protein
MEKIKRKDAHQHKDAAEQGVEKELEGGVKFALAAPDADQKVHGDQADLPEDEKENHIQGSKHADHAGLHDQQADHEALDPHIYGRKGAQYPQHGGQGCQQHQQKAHAVQPQKVADADLRHPGCFFDKLK